MLAHFFLFQSTIRRNWRTDLRTTCGLLSESSRAFCAGYGGYRCCFLLYCGRVELLPVTPTRKQTLVCHYGTKLGGAFPRQNVSAGFFTCRSHPGYFAGPFTRTDDDSG